VALTWPRLPNAANSVVDYGDPLTVIWHMRWISHALLTDPSTLYAAPIYHGFPDPIAYDNIMIGQAIFGAPIAALTGSWELAFNLLVVLCFALNGWCAFLLARHVTGSAYAGFVAGMLYAFWSYTFAHISHLTELTLYFIPITLLCLHRAFESVPSTRNANGTHTQPSLRAALWVLAFAFCFAWQGLYSFYYVLYLALAIGLLLLWELLVVRRWRVWSSRWRAYVAGLLSLALLSWVGVIWQISAPYRNVQQTLGFYRTGSEQAEWSARLSDYLAVSPRNVTYRDILPTVWPEPLFPGFAALILGIIGLGAILFWSVRLRKDAISEETEQGLARPSLVSYYAALAVLALVLSLGPTWDLQEAEIPLPYQLVSLVPGFSGLRAPGRMAAIAALGWGILAGWGWLQALVWVRRMGARSQAVRSGGRLTAIGSGLALAALLAVMAVEHWSVPTPSQPLPPKPAESLRPQGEVPQAYTWLAEQGDGGVLVELPILQGLKDPTLSYMRMYYQAVHNHPLLNGHSSFVPPTYPELALFLDSHGPEVRREHIGVLQSLEVRYMLFSQWAYKQRHWEAIMGSLQTYPEVNSIGQFGEDALFELAPLGEDAQMRLGWRLPTSMPAGATLPITVTLTNVYGYPLLGRLHSTLPLEVRWQRAAPRLGGASMLQGSVLPINLRGAAQWAALQTEQASLADVPMLLEQGAHLFSLDVTTPTELGDYQFELRPTWPLPRYRPAPPAEVTITQRR
jgi:hypothetical protein